MISNLRASPPTRLPFNRCTARVPGHASDTPLPERTRFREIAARGRPRRPPARTRRSRRKGSRPRRDARPTLHGLYGENPLGPMKGAFVHLGYPSCFRIELTIAKTLGVLALLIPRIG